MFLFFYIDKLSYYIMHKRPWLERIIHYSEGVRKCDKSSREPNPLSHLFPLIIWPLITILYGKKSVNPRMWKLSKPCNCFFFFSNWRPTFNIYLFILLINNQTTQNSFQLETVSIKLISVLRVFGLENAPSPTAVSTALRP